MSNLSVAAQTALSYLEDVEKQIERASEIENYATGVDRLKAIRLGDLQLARSEAANTTGSERNHVLAEIEFQDGMIDSAIADQYGKFYPNTKGDVRRHMRAAGEAFSRAIQYDSRPAFHYFLGVAHAAVGEKEAAIAAFQQAANGDDPKIAVEARKEIGRVQTAKGGGGCAGVLALSLVLALAVCIFQAR
jgi:tetratricopeptide (TPR) repeat protein